MTETQLIYPETLNNKEIDTTYLNPIDLQFPEIKCGEVILVEKFNFWFACTFCYDRFLNIVEFLNHFKNEHINSCLANKVNEDPLDFKKSESTIDLKNEIDLDEIAQVDFENDKKYSLNVKEEVDIHEELVADETITPSLKSENNLPSKAKRRKYHLKKSRRQMRECPVCKALILGSNPFYKHLRSHPDYCNHQCDECGKFYRTAHSLKIHSTTIHAGKRRYHCEICDAGFQYPSLLRIHKNLHTGERPFKCETCNKSFISITTLHVHMKLHTVNIPFKCEVCGKEFKIKSHFNMHMRRHNSTKRFACDQCDKSFYENRSLENHKILHSGIKISCDVCKAQFTWKKNLIQHMKLHEKVKQYICKVCTKEFSQHAGLYSHMKSHKNETLE